jgi:predicted transcriptional regulator YdeE
LQLNNKIKKVSKLKIKPYMVIGITVRTISENNQAGKDIADLWGKFMKMFWMQFLAKLITRCLFDNKKWQS